MRDRLHSPRYREFLQRLRAKREQAGLTQEEVAKRLGQTQAYVSKSERGERRVDAVELMDFAEVYGCSITDVLPPKPGQRPKRR